MGPREDGLARKVEGRRPRRRGLRRQRRPLEERLKGSRDPEDDRRRVVQQGQRGQGGRVGPGVDSINFYC